MDDTLIRIRILAQDMASSVMGKLGSTVGDLQSKTMGLAKQGFGQLQAASKMTATAFLGLTASAAALVSAFVGIGFNNSVMIQEAMADVQKAVGTTSQETGILRDQLLDLSTTTRTNTFDLIGIAKIGGQIGVAKDQIVDFTASIDKVTVALGDEFTGGAEEVSSKLGTLRNLFADTAKIPYAEAMLKVGSAINSLGASGTATGPVVAEFATRMGQLGNMGPSITQTLGLGAAMQELGLSAEISSGGLTNIFLTAGKKSAEFAKQLGISEQAFKDLYKASPNDMLLQLADSFKDLANDPVALSKRLDDMGISSQEAVKVMSLLATKTDMVKDKQALAAAEFAKGTSIIDEYNIKNNTFAAAVEKAKNIFIKFSSALWNANLGAIGEQFNKLLGGVTPLYKLLFEGDYTGGLQDAFGWAEDSDIINNILTLRWYVVGFFETFSDYNDDLDETSQRLRGFVPDEVLTAFAIFRKNVLDLIDKFNEFNKDGKLVESFLVGVAGVIAAVVIPALAGLAFWVISVTWPFVLLGGIIAGLYYIWSTNMWGIQDIMIQLWGIIQPILMGLWDLFMNWVWPSIVQLGQSLMELWNVISPYIIPVLQVLGVILGVIVVGAIVILMGVLWALMNFWNMLVSVLTIAIQFLIDIFTNFWTFISEQFAAGQRFFQGLIDFITGVFTGNWQKAWDGLGNMVGGVFDGIVSSAKFALNNVSGIVNALIRGYNQANDIAGLPDIPEIPRFATGKRNFGGGSATINEHGAEALGIGDKVYLPAGTDIYSNSETKKMGGGGGIYIEKIEIKADGAIIDEKSTADWFRKIKKIAKEQGFQTT